MASDFFEKCSKTPFIQRKTHFWGFSRFAKKLLVQHMHFRPHSLKEFGLQYLRKNRNAFWPKTDDLEARIRNLEEISYNKHYSHAIFRHGIIDLLSLKITNIIYGPPSIYLAGMCLVSPRRDETKCERQKTITSQGWYILAHNYFIAIGGNKLLFHIKIE